MTPSITALPTLVAGPGTVLATAALTSQEALREIANQVIMNSPEEARNFATVAGMFAINYCGHPKIAERLIKWATVSADPTSSGDRRYFVKELQRVLVDEGLIPPAKYSRTVGAIRQSGLAVFGHAALAVSAPTAYASLPAILTPFDTSAPDFIDILIREIADGNEEAADRLQIAVAQTPWLFTAEHVEALAKMDEEISQIILVALRHARLDLFPET